MIHVGIFFRSDGHYLNHLLFSDLKICESISCELISRAHSGFQQARREIQTVHVNNFGRSND